jgi:hypothetical protein
MTNHNKRSAEKRAQVLGEQILAIIDACHYISDVETVFTLVNIIGNLASERTELREALAVGTLPD